MNIPTDNQSAPDQAAAAVTLSLRNSRAGPHAECSYWRCASETAKVPLQTRSFWLQKTFSFSAGKPGMPPLFCLFCSGQCQCLIVTTRWETQTRTLVYPNSTTPAILDRVSSETRPTAAAANALPWLYPPTKIVARRQKKAAVWMKSTISRMAGSGAPASS
jgi:hypothetical protein